MPQPHQAGVLPTGAELIAIAETHKAFKVRRHAGMAALNYAHITDDEDQFEWPRSEMRGLIVDEATGEVIARPFQKFWNVGEKGAAGTDWDEPHVILKKLDGSLVYPAGSRWVTRGGVTDTSAKAEALAERIGKPIRTLLQRLRTDPADGAPCTPCFEYTGPDNRIVIRYESPGLTLLAVRRITDGEYWSTSEVARAWSEALGPDGGHPALALVRPILYPADHGHGKPGYAQRLTTDVHSWNANTEGVVVAFEPSGHRVKVKSQQYLALHRARDDYSAESRVLTVLMDGNHEQLLERLSAERKGRPIEYYRQVNEGITTTAAEVARDAAAVWSASAGDRKTAAIRWIERSGTNNGRRMLGFAVFDALTRGGNALEMARSTILKTVQRYCRKQRDIDEKVRRLLGPDPPTWNPPDGNAGDIEA